MITIINVIVGSKLDNKTYTETCIFDTNDYNGVDYSKIIKCRINLNEYEFIIKWYFPDIIDLSTQPEYAENIKTIISNKLIN